MSLDEEKIADLLREGLKVLAIEHDRMRRYKPYYVYRSPQEMFEQFGLCDGSVVRVRRRLYEIQKLVTVESSERIIFYGRRVRRDGTLAACVARIIGPWDDPLTMET